MCGVDGGHYYESVLIIILEAMYIISNMIQYRLHRVIKAYINLKSVNWHYNTCHSMS